MYTLETAVDKIHQNRFTYMIQEPKQNAGKWMPEIIVLMETSKVIEKYKKQYKKWTYMEVQNNEQG